MWNKTICALLCLLLAAPATVPAQTVNVDRLRLNDGPCTLESGTGAPDGVRVGKVCDMYIDLSTGVWYTKWTGVGNTVGWGVGHNADGRVNGNWAITGYTGLPGFVSRITGWRIDNTGSADFRYLFTDELHARAFIADLEQALAGSQRVTKSVAILSNNFFCPAASTPATLSVEDLPGAPGMQVFQANDYVVLRTFNRAGGGLIIGDCVGVVTNPNAPGGTQTWTFTRAAGGNAGNMVAGTMVPAKGIVLDYGVSGNGFYEVTAIDGLYGLNSPYAQVVTWAGAPVSGNLVMRSRFGNLRGVTGLAEYGAFLGTYSPTGGQYIRASDVAFETHNLNLSMYSGTTEVIKLDRAGPTLAIGAAVPTAYGAGTGIWMGNDAGTYKFRVGDPTGNRVTWDGVSLAIVGDGFGMTNINGANVATGTISASKLTVGSGINLIRNADCGVSTVDWTAVSNAAGGVSLVGPSDNLGFTLNGAGTSTCYIHTAGVPNAGTISYATTPLFNVVPGMRYEVSAYLGVNRTGNTRAYIQFYQADGATATGTVDGNNCTTSTPGSTELSDYCRSGAVGTAPALSRRARVFILTTHTGGQADPFVFFLHTFFGEALANQTELSPWGPAGVTEIVGGLIRTGSITANQIAANTITAGQIAAGSITATQIAAGTITGDKIQAKTITSDHITVGQLSAITADLGTINAGTINGIDINGVTITGGSIVGGTISIAAGPQSFYVTNTGQLINYSQITELLDVNQILITEFLQVEGNLTMIDMVGDKSVSGYACFDANGTIFRSESGC